MAPLPEGKFYFHEVQGWTAVDRSTSKAIGTILHVVDQGAYPMLEVDFGEGNVGDLSPCRNMCKWRFSARPKRWWSTFPMAFSTYTLPQKTLTNWRTTTCLSTSWTPP